MLILKCMWIGKLPLRVMREDVAQRGKESLALIHSGEAKKRALEFQSLVKLAERYHVFKTQEFNAGGWREVHCPWIASHTDRADSGAALGIFNEENQWTGAFACHHGHCREKGIRDFQEWLNELALEELETED
jgi:hypothetical protein